MQVGVIFIEKAKDKIETMKVGFSGLVIFIKKVKTKAGDCIGYCSFCKLVLLIKTKMKVKITLVIASVN